MFTDNKIIVCSEIFNMEYLAKLNFDFAEDFNDNTLYINLNGQLDSLIVF